MFFLALVLFLHLDTEAPQIVGKFKTLEDCEKAALVQTFEHRLQMKPGAYVCLRLESNA